MAMVETSTDTYKNWTPFQCKLYNRARKEAGFRFYSLIDKVSDINNLQRAYLDSKTKNGAPGWDGDTFESITQNGLSEWLHGLSQDIRTASYRPSPLRQVLKQEGDDKVRPLAIPTIRDRTVQGVVHALLEPVFEADFSDASYAYRQGRSAHQAIQALLQDVRDGYEYLYRLDIRACFDSLPHNVIMQEVQRRVTDSSLLALVRGWLKAPVITAEGKMGVRAAGTAQGGVISPLLANVALNRFDQDWTQYAAHQEMLSVKLIRYADDIALLSKRPNDDVMLQAVNMLTAMGLTINAEKTRRSDFSSGQPISFLGYEISRANGQEIKLAPTPRAIRKFGDRIALLTEKHYPYGLVETIRIINGYLTGWATYFHLTTDQAVFDLLNDCVATQVRSIVPFQERTLPQPKLAAHLARLGLQRLALE